MKNRLFAAGIVLALAVLLSGCSLGWRAAVQLPGEPPWAVDRPLLRQLSRFEQQVDGRSLVPLERLLEQAGAAAVERVIVVEPDGSRHEYEWLAVAEDSWWLPDGRLRIASETLPVAVVEVEQAALLDRVQVHITDIAPTIAAALGVPAPDRATGTARPVAPADHALLLYLDGLGYQRYQEAARLGLVPNLAALGEPLLGLTVYPPATTLASAALLTGARPAANGVEVRGIRQTAAPTLPDVLAAAGRTVLAIEGDAMAFDLRNAEVRLSGDRDGNGLTDDNVLSNTLDILQDGMPDLLWVHFHGIDDAGHTYGVGTPEQDARVAAVDAAVGEILEALPPHTLVVIVADHGMHPVRQDAEERRGNHGQLVAADMFIPVWIVQH